MYNDVLDVRKALYDIETAPAQMYEKLMKSDPYKLSISMVSRHCEWNDKPLCQGDRYI